MSQCLRLKMSHPRLVSPGRWRRVVVEQPLRVLFQPRAAQPRRSGQVVPVKMKAGKGQAPVERVFDLDRIAAFVVMMADM